MNPVVHFEMAYDDAERMQTFYTAAFGWQMQALGEQMGHYVLATTTRMDANPGMPAGAINGGFYPKRPDCPLYPSVVIAVADITEAMAKVSVAGGEVLGEPMEIPGVGLYVAFHDSEGNRVSMLQAFPQTSM